MGHYSAPLRSIKILANEFWKEGQETLPPNPGSLGHTLVGGDDGGAPCGFAFTLKIGS